VRALKNLDRLNAALASKPESTFGVRHPRSTSVDSGYPCRLQRVDMTRTSRSAQRRVKIKIKNSAHQICKNPFFIIFCDSKREQTMQLGIREPSGELSCRCSLRRVVVLHTLFCARRHIFRLTFPFTPQIYCVSFEKNY